MSRRFSAVALGAIILSAAAPLGAQSAAQKKQADALFDEGRKLLSQPATLDEACEKFKESYELMARGATLLNFAECHRRQGKTATAWKEFGHAIELAREAKFAPGIKAATQLHADLEAKLSFLTIRVTPDTAALRGFELTLNGYAVPRDAWDQPVPVDPGPFEIAAKAEGHLPFSASIKVDPEGDKREVTVTLAPVPAAPPPPPAPKLNPIEDNAKASRFIGLRFRDVIVPRFMIDIFVNGGATVNVPMFGPEFTTQKGHGEFDVAVQFADYSMKPLLFKGKNDADAAYELASSTLKMMLFTVDFLYNVPIDKKGRFAFLVGGGLGFGIVFGNLYHVQALPRVTNASPDKPGDWSPCKEPGEGSMVGAVPYCDNVNDHYDNFSEPSWANGGSKPNLFPWITLPQLSFRYKPMKQIQTRFDTGFSSSGFFLGLSAGYGL